MPLVRRQREISQAPIPGVRKSAGETALSRGAGLEQAKAGLGHAISDFGETVARVGIAKFHQIKQEEQAKANNVVRLEMSNHAAKFEADYQAEMVKRQGKDAMGVPEDFEEKFTKAFGDIEKLATTDEQKEDYRQIKARYYQSGYATTRRYTANQIEAHAKGELDSKVKNTLNAAVINAHDPDRVELEIREGEAAIRTTAPQFGHGKEAIEEMVGTFKSQALGGVITRLLDSNDIEARVYFEEHKKEITDGKVLASLEKAVNVGSVRGESQRQAAVILAAGGTLAEQRERAKEVKDPEVQDAVMQRLEHEAMVQDRAEREAEQQAMRGAYDILDKTGNTNSIPAAVWAGLDGNTRAAMKRYAEDKTQGTPTKTDLPTYYGLVQQAMEDPATFADPSKTNLLKYRHLLDETEFKQLAGLQMNITAGNRNAVEKDLGGLRTTLQIINDTLPQYKIPTDEKDQKPGDAQAIAQLKRSVDQAVAEEGARTGKKPDAMFVQRTVDQLLSASVTKQTPAGIYQWATGSNYTQQRLLSSTIADVPDAQRAMITAALQSKGRAVNDAAVLDVYIAFMQNQQRRK